MPRTTLLSISAGTAVLVGRDVDGTPIGGLYRPGGARPCPCALLAQTVRLTMSNHGALTRIYYGKFPDSENSKNRLRGTPLSLGASHPYPGGLQLICCFRVQGSDPPKASKFRDGEGAIVRTRLPIARGARAPPSGADGSRAFFSAALCLIQSLPWLLLRRNRKQVSRRPWSDWKKSWRRWNPGKCY